MAWSKVTLKHIGTVSERLLKRHHFVLKYWNVFYKFIFSSTYTKVLGPVDVKQLQNISFGCFITVRMCCDLMGSPMLRLAVFARNPWNKKCLLSLKITCLVYSRIYIFSPSFFLLHVLTTLFLFEVFKSPPPLVHEAYIQLSIKQRSH